MQITRSTLGLFYVVYNNNLKLCFSCWLPTVTFLQ